MNPLTFFATTTQCAHSFFGLVPWYQNLVVPDPANPGACKVILDLVNTSKWDGLWVIGLNIIDDLLRVAGFLALVYVIYGGIRYITSQGEPQNVSDAQGTVLNGLIGLVIAGVAAGVVDFLSSKLGGNLTSTGNYNLPNVAANKPTLEIVLSIVFAVVGAISVIMIMIGGFQYITSRGEGQQTAKAKNTIMYAAIGLAVCACAFIIVNFVIGNLL